MKFSWDELVESASDGIVIATKLEGGQKIVITPSLSDDETIKAAFTYTETKTLRWLRLAAARAFHRPERVYKTIAQSWRQTWFSPWSPRMLSLAAAASLLLIFGVGWLIRENRKLHDELSILRAEQKEWLQHEQEWQRQLAELHAQFSSSASPTSPKTVATPTPRMTPGAQFPLPAIVLMPGPRSGSEVKEVSFAPVARRLPLRLALNREPTSRGYTAVLHSADDKEIARRSRLRATNNGRLIFVEVVFPTALLEAGEYTMKLFGTGRTGRPEEPSVYSFRVVKR
jgi:hypothetical protein